MTESTGAVPGQVALAVGETVTIALPSLAGAGYLWQSRVEGADGVVEVELHRGGPAPGPPGRVGAAGPETVRLTALAAGRAIVRLEQRRPWEHDVAPIAAHDVQIVVE